MKKTNILIVDDNKMALTLLEEILSQAGYGVIRADSGETAVTLAKKHLPDLILLDINMPGIDGEKATDILRYDDSTRAIPIVYQTCLVGKDEIDDAYVSGSKIGNINFIPKPYEKNEVLRVVGKYVSSENLEDN